MSDWAGTPEQEIETLREMVEQRDVEIDSLWETIIKVGDYLEIDVERARKIRGKPSQVFLAAILRKQAEALEAHAESIRKWAEHTNINFMFAHGALAAANQAEKYAQQLRDGVDKGGDDEYGIHP